MYYNVESINLKSKYETEEVKEFLGKFNLKYEDVDYTVVISCLLYTSRCV